MTDMTVLEFAAHHVKTEQCQWTVKHHVDLLIAGALNRNRTLWNVVRDNEGHPSLIWVSMPVEAWEQLLERVIAATSEAALAARASAEIDAFLKRVFPG